MLSSAHVQKPRRKAPHPGERLLELRRARKWSQEQVAARTGLTVRTISNLERAVGEPSRIHPETYDKLARLFGVAVEELDPRRRRRWLAQAEVTPEQMQLIENILALPPDRLDVVKRTLARLKDKKR
jgi:transcriptional regulator with XRE-family HTH domain